MRMIFDIFLQALEIGSFLLVSPRFRLRLCFDLNVQQTPAHNCQQVSLFFTLVLSQSNKTRLSIS